MPAYQISEVVEDFFALVVAYFERYQYIEKSLYQAI